MTTKLLRGLNRANRFALTAAMALTASLAVANEPKANVSQATEAPKAATKMVKANPALWVVKDADTTIYLFGTIHVLKPGMTWFEGPVRNAFAKSDSLVLELVTPPVNEVQEAYSRLAINTTGKTARSKMTAEERTKYETALKKMELDPASLDPFEPWATAITMQLLSATKLGFNPDDGAESTLTSAAKASNKPIIGLETMEFQLGTLDQIPEDKQIRFLMDTVNELDNVKGGMDDLLAKWAKPDPDGLARIMNESMTDPYIFDALLTKRNANWAKWIARRMDEPGTVFLAVGAGHLSGKTSVPVMLKGYGIKTKRVKR
jgi:uncharacterized protein YbaP (TraB family)